MSTPAVLPPTLTAVASSGLAPSAESPARRKAPLWMELAISGISVGGATTATNPLGASETLARDAFTTLSAALPTSTSSPPAPANVDVIKTRLQLYTRTNAAVAAPGLVGTALLPVPWHLPSQGVSGKGVQGSWHREQNSGS